jgi:hypothetical protein
MFDICESLSIMGAKVYGNMISTCEDITRLFHSIYSSYLVITTLELKIVNSEMIITSYCSSVEVSNKFGYNLGS